MRIPESKCPVRKQVDFANEVARESVRAIFVIIYQGLVRIPGGKKQALLRVHISCDTMRIKRGFYA